MSNKTQLQQNNIELREHYAYIPTMPTADEARNGQYTWHKYEVLEGKKGKSVGFVVDDSETAYPMDGIHTDGFYYILYGMPFQIVTWADGTDEEIVAMVQAADEGKINLSDYWSVGQQRKITISAMPATGVDESHAKQSAILVLTQVGGKTLSNGKECSFQVDLKNVLTGKGYMNPSYTNTGGWNSCPRRTWCNNVFKNAMPSTLLPIFKEFKNQTGKGGSATTTQESIDYFALRSEIELFGDNSLSVDGEGYHVEYYKTAANRKKKGTSWLRSPEKGNNANFLGVTATGVLFGYESANTYGFAPFGCI